MTSFDNIHSSADNKNYLARENIEPTEARNAVPNANILEVCSSKESEPSRSQSGTKPNVRSHRGRTEPLY